MWKRRIAPIAIRSTIALVVLAGAHGNFLSSPSCSTTTKGKILKHNFDNYDGVIITDDLKCSPEEFEKNLRSSLQEWVSNLKKGVWLKLPPEKIDLASVAVENGFSFHHAEREHLMLNMWLSESENTLPPNASHQVGVGCVLERQGRLLCVQEKYGPLRGLGVWKLPTGLIHAGENIAESAVRETFEETGVASEFVGIIAVRHGHGFNFGKSDLFFVCVLRPLSSEIKLQESEIEKAEWIPLDDYFNQPSLRSNKVAEGINDAIKDALQNPSIVVPVQMLSSPWGKDMALYKLSTSSVEKR